MPTWLTEDPTEIWDGLDETLQRKAARWITRAETIIRTKFPTIQDRIDAGTLPVEAVAGVVEEMVDRAIAHDERGGVSSERLPEWQVDYEAAAGLGQGSRLFLTTDEFALLALPRRQPCGVRSIRMRRAHEVTDPAPPPP